MPAKVCSKCKDRKPLTAFGRVGGAKGALPRSVCKACNSAQATAWNKAHPERFKRTLRRSQLKVKYGITSETYEALYTSQKGVCAICKKAENKNRLGTLMRLSVDHNHQTGAVRGLLCAGCNSHLGRFEKHRSAIEAYLSKY